MTTSMPNLPVHYGGDTLAIFYPPVNFNYYDAEPGEQRTSADEIKSLVTGTKKLGSWFQMAFTGEEVDTRWFNATDAPDDWGDSSGLDGGSFTHTYAHHGFYWIKANGAGGANAVRMMRVVDRGPAPQQQAEFYSMPIHYHQFPYYQVSIDPRTEGAIDSSFAMKFTIKTDGYYPRDANIGYMVGQGGVAVFAEVYDDNIKRPRIYIVCGGFVTNRTLTINPDGDILSGTAYDPLFWINMAYMREQQYDDMAMMAYAQNQQAYNNLTAAGAIDPNTGTIDGTVAAGLNPDDIFQMQANLLGYVPQHFLKSCRPDYAAAHILQHVRVSVTSNPFPNPPMFNKPSATSYGTLAQFTNFYVSPSYDEINALGGFHAFSVGNGSVLSNVKQMLENNGSIIHSRSDMSFVMDQKPFYKDTPPTPTLSLTIPNVPGIIDILESVPANIYKIQIEKPVLGVTLAGNSAAATQGETVYFCPGGGGCETISLSDYAALAGIVSQYSDQTISEEGKMNVEDALNSSIKPSDFLYEFTCGDPGGQIIGPIANVFTNDLETFARGVCREKRAHWQIVVSLGNVYDVDLGDIVAVTYFRDNGLAIDWKDKLFWVTRVQILINQVRYTRQITLLEVQPDTVGNLGTGATINTPSARTDPCVDVTFPTPVITNIELVKYGDGGYIPCKDEPPRDGNEQASMNSYQFTDAYALIKLTYTGGPDPYVRGDGTSFHWPPLLTWAFLSEKLSSEPTCDSQFSPGENYFTVPRGSREYKIMFTTHCGITVPSAGYSFDTG